MVVDVNKNKSNDRYIENINTNTNPPIKILEKAMKGKSIPYKPLLNSSDYKKCIHYRPEEKILTCPLYGYCMVKKELVTKCSEFKPKTRKYLKYKTYKLKRKLQKRNNLFGRQINSFFKRNCRASSRN